MLRRNCFWIDFNQCCHCLCSAAECYVLLLLGYKEQNMVICSLTGVSCCGSLLDFPWKRSGQESDVLVILGSGSEGITSDTAGDQLAGRIRRCVTSKRTCVAPQARPNIWEKMMCLHVFMQQTQTCTGYLMCFLLFGEKGRGILLMYLSVSTSYMEQRPAPLRPPASPSPLLPWPSLPDWFSPSWPLV